MVPLLSMRSGPTLRAAKRANEQYIKEQRDEMRELLIRAARAVQLEAMDSRLPDFDGSTLARAIDCDEGGQDASELRAQMDTALTALFAVDDTDGVVAIDDLLRHMGITDPAARAQVESILEGMDEEYTSSSILMYREGLIHCG